MAKGKYADRAVRRMSQEAIDTIDRLTERLAEEKRRRLDAEKRAAAFSASENTARILEAQNDEALAKALEKLQWWKDVAKEDRARRYAALDELREKFWSDMRLKHLTHVEQIEFVERRYPRLIAALSAGQRSRLAADIRDLTSPYRAFESKLTAADLVRFQQITGQRHTLTTEGPGASMAVDYAALFEAEQEGFDFEDALELAVDERGLDSTLGSARTQLEDSK